jgi:hypothetical protein
MHVRLHHRRVQPCLPTANHPFFRWTFDETEREVRRSLVYRQLVRVYFERVPDAKTLIRLSAAIGPDGRTIHERLVEMSR